MGRAAALLGAGAAVAAWYAIAPHLDPLTLWQNVVLYRAGEDFDLVARTDTDDLDYLARGLDRLRQVFKIQVMVVVVTIAVAFGTAAAMLALYRYAG